MITLLLAIILAQDVSLKDGRTLSANLNFKSYGIIDRDLKLKVYWDEVDLKSLPNSIIQSQRHLALSYIYKAKRYEKKGDMSKSQKYYQAIFDRLAFLTNEDLKNPALKDIKHKAAGEIFLSNKWVGKKELKWFSIIDYKKSSDYYEIKNYADAIHISNSTSDPIKAQAHLLTAMKSYPKSPFKKQAEQTLVKVKEFQTFLANQKIFSDTELANINLKNYKHKVVLKKKEMERKKEDEKRKGPQIHSLETNFVD
ncbi:MAG: hypothetical protein HRT89_22365, partial [Lentisphaeria bacterium]|nr:hypothetical protein [Lentisphaeria bacterium]NQZ70803.1 hypothetical protein [Lentisphaeria bacterium]